MAPIRALPAPTPPLRDKNADEPLSASEVQQMKEHFAFLRTHRKLLKLRLNATEDLLLNGVREPVHRGVCQHLLAKVEKDRVLAVSERLPAPEAAKLLAGVLRFAPEVAYVLRYLECLSDVSSQPEAAAALAHALKRIQFNETSSAQMRQVLSLIVNVFPDAELPVLIFNWLSNSAFLSALDRSSEALPEQLGTRVVPLRAAYRALVQEPEATHPSFRLAANPDLAMGIRLLLASPKSTLLELSQGVRRRLLEYGRRLELEQTREWQGLIDIYRSLNWRQARARGEVGLALAGALLRAGAEKEAGDFLRQEVFDTESDTQAKRWLRLLRGPRLGPVALDRKPRAKARGESKTDNGPELRDGAPPGRWLRGFHLPTQLNVRVRYGPAEQRAAFADQAALWQRSLVPGVARLVVLGTDAERPFLAVCLMGRNLLAFMEAPGLDSSTRFGMALELCALLHATAHTGLALPDADANRFSVDDCSRVWLVDLWDAAQCGVDAAVERHTQLAVALFSRILKEHPIVEQLRQAGSLLEMADLLHRERHLI